MDVFRPFTFTHAVMLCSIAVLIWLLVIAGRRQRAAAPTRFELTLAITNLAFWIIAHGWWQLPPRFDPATTLPLQMCHLTSVIASLVLLTRRHFLRILLYFWGFGLCTQALLTPSLADSPATVWFWAFWFQHGFIMAVAVYDVAVYGFRPVWRDFSLACAASAGYVVLVLPLNVLLGANYGFVGNSRPDNPSIVDLLGPWPGRLIIIVLLVAAVLALLMLPWEIARHRHMTTQ
jgi:hypothetical integral membrane protein (TIGR02206 family)